MLPILFQSPDFVLYSYPLMMGIGWGIAYQVFLGSFPAYLNKSFALIIFWGCFISSWMGAKILYLVTSQTAAVNHFSFWTGGGFVFYGGLIAALIFLALLRLLKFPLCLDVLFPMLPALAFGHGIGRIGCLLAGCCFGAESNWWWGVHLHGTLRHPTQLLEAIGLLTLGWALLRIKRPLAAIIIYFLTYGILRLLIESLRGDSVRGSWGIMTPSQWISLTLIGISIWLLFRLKSKA